MLDTTETYSRLEEFIGGGRQRVRYLGIHGDSDILISVNTAKTTEIVVLSDRGQSVIAFSTNSYLDIVAGDLSPLNNFLHLTIRLPSVDGFTFESYVIEIHTLKQTPVFVSPEIITAVFLSQDCESAADLLHFSNFTLQQLRLNLSSATIRSERVRGGINFSDVLSWSYKSATNHLTVMSSDHRMFDFQIGRKPLLKSIYVCPPPHSTSQLPATLSLSPKSLSNFSVFRFSQNRVNILRFNSTYCVIEQLYDADEPDLSFLYSVFPHSHSAVVAVPGVAAHFPICTFQEGSFVIVFVPNRFVCVVDLQKPVRHFVFGAALAASPASDHCAAIAISRTFMDVFSGRVHRCRLNVVRAIALAGTECAEFAAVAAARFLSAGSAAALFTVVGQPERPLLAAGAFFHCFGAARDRRDVERELRSSPVAETVLVAVLAHRKGTRPGDDVAARAVRTLDAQLNQNADVGRGQRMTHTHTESSQHCSRSSSARIRSRRSPARPRRRSRTSATGM
jgi:hypothetical protein